MKIAVSSGKGGTGKTFLATNLAWLLARSGEPITYLDCDVEAPNGHLFLKPAIHRTETMTVRAPVRIEQHRCTACGRCAEVCRYNAIALLRDRALLFPELCHACGACSLVCPEGAILEGDKEIGEIRHGEAAGVEVHYGLLKTAAGGMSPRLIRALKKHAGPGITILDSPPGTACPAVETVRGTDVCLLVADPTPFALYDLKLSVNMCRQVGQEPAVVLNRSGLDASDLKEYCSRAQLEILGEIPDDRRIAEVYSVGGMVLERLPEYRPRFEELLRRVRQMAAERRPVRRDLIQPPFRPGGRLERPRRPGDAGPRPVEVVVVSGKGGTGKTSLAACFAQLSDGAAVSDCDVDASDLHLVLDPQVREEGDFTGGVAVEIDPDGCTLCGRCREECRFEAVVLTGGRYAIDPVACEGCGVCELVCPVQAVRSREAVNGKWFVSRTRFGPMSHAILGPAEENSGRLVTLVRDLGVGLATGRVLIDGSPGTGCPVIASVSGASYAVVVTEPTVSGLHDLQRILALTRHFGVETGVVVNKADLNREMTESICAASERAGVEPLGTIPYDEDFTKAQIQRKTLLEHAPHRPTASLVRSLWQRISRHVQPRRPRQT